MMIKNATLKCIAAGGALSLLAFCPLVARAQTPPASPAPVSTGDTARQKAEVSEIFPRDHWVYAELTAMEKRGVSMYGPDHMVKDVYPLTRYQLAGLVVRVLDRLPTTSTPDDGKSIALYVRSIGFDFLNRAIKEVMPELLDMHIDVAKAKERLFQYGPTTARQTSFTDMPPQGHWARESVEKVRAAGVLVGYEDGTLNENGR